MHKPHTESEFLGWYDQFADSIFRHAFFRLSDREKAKDLTQETFVRLWDYVAQGKEVENARAFIYRIANNLIIDQYRQREALSLDTLQEEQGFDVGHDPRITHEHTFEYERLLAFLETLPRQYREALTLRHIDGFSVKEIAQILKESENVVSVRIHRAIEKLKATYPHDHE